MGPKIIGVEFGSETLKLSVCSGKKVLYMAVERFPEGLVTDGRVSAPATMIQFVKQMCAEHKIGRGPCALVINSQNTIARKLQMPVMGEAELKLNLPFEFRDFVGKDANKYEYDYAMVQVKDNLMDVYAAAVRKDLLEEYGNILRKAGLTLKAAMPEEMAWLNIVRAAENKPKQLCIVDIGAAHTRVNIFANDQYVMGKDIDIGGRRFDDAIAAAEKVEQLVARLHKEENVNNVTTLPGCADLYAQLSVEIMRIINFYCSSTPDGNDLQDIYFCGGCSSIDALRTAIIKRTNFTTHHIRRLLELSGTDYVSEFCALSAGAAMQVR